MEYIDKLTAILKKLENEKDEIEKAGDIIASAVKDNRLVHYFGTEPRACALISEIFFNAGALAYIDPMLDPTLDPAHGAYRNEMALAVDGLAPCILDYYERVAVGDPIVLVGSCAGLPMFAQSLEWAKGHGLKTIAILCEGSCIKDETSADVLLTNGTEYEDNSAYTVSTAALLNMIIDSAKTKLPESAAWSGKRSVDLGKEENKINEMLFRIRHL